jgi:hypothetical protein
MPIRTISGFNTGLDLPNGIARLRDTDGRGEIYAANAGSYTITVYAAGAEGDRKPIRIIGGSSTQMYAPVGVALDNAGVIYVANDRGGSDGIGSVTVYAADANGNVAPIRTIAGSNTGMLFPVGIAIH